MREYRRIQKTGESTYIISLPKKWAGVNHVQQGTEASIRENEDGSLVISVRREVSDSIATINSLPSLERTLQKVVAAYIAGYDKIVLKGVNAAAVCEEARFRLSGVEIVDEKPEEAMLSILSRGEEFNLENILKRMNSISVALLSIVIQGVNGEKGLEKESARRETEIDRLYILALRTINIQASKLSLGVCYARASKTLERISDHIDLLYSEAVKVPKNKDAISLANQLKKLYEEIFENFSNAISSEKTIVSLHDYQNQINALKDKASLPFKAFLDRCLRISEYLFDMTEITEDMLAIKGSF